MKMRLGDLRYDRNDYGDMVPPRKGVPSRKYLYMRDSKAFLRFVRSWLPPLSSSKILSSPAGSLLPGDTTLNGEVEGRFLHVGLIYDEDRGHAVAYWRVGRRGYAADGANTWVEDPAATPSYLAEQIRLRLRVTALGSTEP